MASRIVDLLLCCVAQVVPHDSTFAPHTTMHIMIDTFKHLRQPVTAKTHPSDTGDM
jgi:hypothetical protein